MSEQLNSIQEKIGTLCHSGKYNEAIPLMEEAIKMTIKE